MSFKSFDPLIPQGMKNKKVSIANIFHNVGRTVHTFFRLTDLKKKRKRQRRFSTECFKSRQFCLWLQFFPCVMIKHSTETSYVADYIFCFVLYIRLVECIKNEDNKTKHDHVNRHFEEELGYFFLLNTVLFIVRNPKLGINKQIFTHFA